MNPPTSDNRMPGQGATSRFRNGQNPILKRLRIGRF